MPEQEQLLQWLLATGADPQAEPPDPRWRDLLQNDPLWREVAQQIRRWDRQLAQQLFQGPLPEPPSAQLRQRVLQAIAAAAEAAPASPKPSSGSKTVAPQVTTQGESAWVRFGPRHLGAWKAVAALVGLVVVLLLWWFWPPASARLARSAWDRVQSADFQQPEHWITRRQTDPADEVPPVLRVSRRVRWRPVRLQGWQGVVHHLMNHEAQSVQAWLFVLRGQLKSVPEHPPKQPQWQSAQAAGGCWFDPRRERTYVLIVPGTVQQYRFWITAGPLAIRLSELPLSEPPKTEQRIPSCPSRPRAWAKDGNRLF